MKRSTALLVGSAVLLIGAGGARLALLEAAPASALPATAPEQQAPVFDVDPLWPKPMPNHWLLGSAVGLAIDSRDHVFVTHLGPSSFNLRTEIGAYSESTAPSECCAPAPQVLEFDADGNLVGHWGGPADGVAWPVSNHGLAIDPSGMIWIGGSGGTDSHIAKFTREGRFVGTIGKVTTAAPAAPAAQDTAYQGVSRGAAGARGGAGGGRGGRGGRGGGRGGRGAAGPPPLPPNSASMDSFGGPAAFSFDAAAGEAFVADGYRNRRVAVVDIRTGAIKRFWGASGRAPVDTDTTNAQFGTPVTCAELSRDGLVYVCDRSNNRIQVFRKTGDFVREKIVAPATRGEGSVWDIAFSPDAQQRWLYVADGTNSKVRILDRQSLNEVGTIGDGGRQPGRFYGLHSVATDSRGNVYTVETYQGKRVQKFVLRGGTR